MLPGFEVILSSSDGVSKADAGAAEVLTWPATLDVLLELGIDLEVEDFCLVCDGFVDGCCLVLAMDVDSTCVSAPDCISLVMVVTPLLDTWSITDS